MQWFGGDDRRDAQRPRADLPRHPSPPSSSATLLEAAAGAILLTLGSLGTYHVYRRRLRRYPTINHLPAQVYSPNFDRGLLGYVTSVGDGDNFRFYHTPGGYLAGWGWLRRVPSDKKSLRNQTIHVRIAGVDAPELAHFGKPAQPYGREALDWLTAYVQGRRVRVYVHSRDRFDRVVANPKIRTWPAKWTRRDVGLEQVKAGLATVFREGGAEYGGMLPLLERAENDARKAHRGMWARGKKLETPAEYKRRTRGEDTSDAASKSTNASTATTNTKDGVGKVQQISSAASSTFSWAKWLIGR